MTAVHDKHLSWQNDRVSYLMKCRVATRVNMFVPTVMRALADLIEAEMVESARGENCVHIRVA